MSIDLELLLNRALDARAALRDPSFEGALRLFNGFLEGCPELALDLYGRTAVIHDHGDVPATSDARIEIVARWLPTRIPEVRAILIKHHKSENEADRRGHLKLGTERELDRKIRENGIWYALDLRLNRDASLYLDTRQLRAWATSKLAGKKVLNTFAYTGSLGVAARAAPASQVIQTDLNRDFLNVGKVSFELNRWPVTKTDFRRGDFFEVMGELKRTDALFDCVFVDPPFFSTTDKGTVNLQAEASRLLNKVRPLIGDGGYLVAINNAVFVSGAEYLKQLETLCADGYLTLEERIEVPADCTGFAATRVGAPVADPAPFNHSTKIAILRAKRKDGRKAS